MTVKKMTVKKYQEIKIKFISEFQGEIDFLNTASGEEIYFTFSAKETGYDVLEVSFCGKGISEVVPEYTQKRITDKIRENWERCINGISENFEKKTHSLKSIVEVLVSEYLTLSDITRELYYRVNRENPSTEEAENILQEIKVTDIKRNTLMKTAEAFGISSEEWQFYEIEAVLKAEEEEEKQALL